MATVLGEAGRRLANWAARIKLLREEKVGSSMVTEADNSHPETTGLYQNTNDPFTQPPPNAFLEYVSPTWIDNPSIADTNSTITRAQLGIMGLQESRSMHAIGSLSYHLPSRYDNAVQYIYSVPDSRSQSSLYYTENGRLGSPKQSRTVREQGHGYRFGDTSAQPVKGNAFPVTESVHPDWKFHSLSRNQAGHWSLQDFSEQHLADRLFYNAQIRNPAEHLQGSQKAAAQELRALCMENPALRSTLSEAIATADWLEEHAQDLKIKTHQTDEDIGDMRSCLDAETLGISRP